MSVTVADVLNQAAELVEFGWTKGAYARTAAGDELDLGQKGGICWCTSGAIGEAVRRLNQRFDEGLFFEATEEFRRALRIRDEVPEWNDRASRRKGQVITALRRTAALAREQEGQGQP